jgi:hypothetical protein
MSESVCKNPFSGKTGPNAVSPSKSRRPVQFVNWFARTGAASYDSTQVRFHPLMTPGVAHVDFTS